MLEAFETAKKRIADPTCHHPELKRLLDNWAYPKGDEFKRGRAREKAYGAALHKLQKAATVNQAIKSMDMDKIILTLEDWPHGVDDPAYLAAMKSMDEYTEQCKVVRAATEKNDGVSMKEALAQLKYTTSDVDFVELKVNWERYSKVEKKMQDAIDAD